MGTHFHFECDINRPRFKSSSRRSHGDKQVLLGTYFIIQRFNKAGMLEYCYSLYAPVKSVSEAKGVVKRWKLDGGNVGMMVFNISLNE